MDMDNIVEVVVRSPWVSKINWTQVVAVAAMLGTMFGLDVPPDLQAKIVATIVAVQGLATVILRTWFTNSVTPVVAERDVKAGDA